MIDRALEALGDECSKAGKQRLFEQLRATLSDDPGEASHRAIAAELGMTPEAVKVAAHRLRRRFREVLEEEIGETVASPADVEDEIRFLLSALAW